MAVPLDAIDRDILAVLRADGRVSVRALADQVHASRSNVYARLGRMVETGVIRGFTARVDPVRAGLGTSAYLTVKVEQNSWRSFSERVRRLPQVAHVALVGGEFDVVLLVRTADNEALRDLVLNVIQDMPEVRSTRTLLVFDEAEGPAP